MTKEQKRIAKGWMLLSIGTLMISSAAGVVWGFPVALGVAGAWVIVFGISMLSNED